MWRRLLTSSSKSVTSLSRFSTLNLTKTFLTSAQSQSTFSSTPPFQRTIPPFSSDNLRIVEDVMPIATGHEREEVQAELQESAAIVKSVYDKRIIGCAGDEGEDEHDVVWFWLEKGKPHECHVCSQHFKLEVVGPGGSPYGHGDDNH